MAKTEVEPGEEKEMTSETLVSAMDREEMVALWMNSEDRAWNIKEGRMTPGFWLAYLGCWSCHNGEGLREAEGAQRCQVILRPLNGAVRYLHILTWNLEKLWHEDFFGLRFFRVNIRRKLGRAWRS